MDNYENNNLIPGSDPIPAPQEEMPPLEAVAPQPEAEGAPMETEPVFAEADPVPAPESEAQTQPPKYEWDCGMEFPPKSPKKKKEYAAKPKSRVWGRILAGVLVVALVAGGCLATSLTLNSYWLEQNKALKQQLSTMQSKLEKLQAQIKDNSFTGNGNSLSGTGTTDGLTPGQVYAQNVDAVVAITAYIPAGSMGQSSSASGSGFLLTENGYVVTNYHVIESATRVEVTTSVSDTYMAKVVGYDAAHDVAVLKIEATGLPHVTLGSSDDLIVGDQITVIGNPLGELSYTQTVGYISGKDRGVSTDNTLINMLQTDASINSGNSGGPMFNMKGEVVGIITAKYSGTSSSGASIEGIGFAIPIDDVVKKIQDLMDYGYITGAYLGVSVRDVDSTVSQAYGLPMGAYVVTVEKENCAYAAGVREKDIIVGLGEYTVSSLNALSSALQEFKAGDTTTISVWRSGTVLQLEITLDEKPH